MLSHKFKLKYGNQPAIAAYIDTEVNKLLKNERLTQENLQKLDEKIGRESILRDKKEVKNEAILSDR